MGGRNGGGGYSGGAAAPGHGGTFCLTLDSRVRPDHRRAERSFSSAVGSSPVDGPIVTAMTTHARPVALVTGASRGIGRCAAIALARAGCDVVISARTVHEGEGRAATAAGSVILPGSLETTAQEISAAGAEVQVAAMDLLDRASVEEVAAVATARWGRLDVLVNNAIYQGPGPMERLADLSIAEAETTMRADYLHQLLLIQRVLPTMLAGGGGSIVNMSSGTAYLDPPAATGHGGWGIAYAAAKAALTRIVPILHVEHAGDGIRAFNVDPGFVVNERMRATAGSRSVHRRRVPGRTARGPRGRRGLVGHRSGGRRLRRHPGPGPEAVPGARARPRLASADVVVDDRSYSG